MQTLGIADNRELLLHVAKALGRGATGTAGDLLLGEGEDV